MAPCHIRFCFVHGALRKRKHAVRVDSTETRLATFRCGCRGPSACVSVRPRVPNNRRRMSTIFTSSERFMNASVTEVMLLKAHVEIISGSPLFARLSGWPVHCQGAGSLRRLGGGEKKRYAET